MKKVSLLVIVLVSVVSVFYIRTANESSNSADLVIFSFNRPLQLYALLESVEKHISGLNEIHVIYRASDASFAQGYQIVSDSFTQVKWHQQGSNPKQDFKPLTLEAAFQSPSAYIIFAVDDIVVKDTIDAAKCVQLLDQYGAYGFYFRLGKNLDQCYSYGSASQPLPPFKQEEQGLFSWQFNQGKYDWGYPHTVDMTLFAKKDIEADLRVSSYHAPNKLEDVWHRRSHAIMSKRGLCYQASKIVNMPLNRVQHEYNNRAMAELTPQDLLKEFLNGKKMDINPLYCINNRAAHMEYSPTFINR